MTHTNRRTQHMHDTIDFAEDFAATVQRFATGIHVHAAKLHSDPTDAATLAEVDRDVSTLIDHANAAAEHARQARGRAERSADTVHLGEPSATGDVSELATRVAGLVAGLGCDEIQGYYLSRPMSAGDVVAWLRDGPWQSETSLAA
jgi:hypothetical protein